MLNLVTVIIPSFNRRYDLCRCIDSISEQIAVSLEIIVVDDCSEDDTREYLGTNYPDVHLIPCKQRYGPSYLRNLGLREAKGDFVLFLDSDVVIPRKDIIRRMVDILLHNKNIGEIGGEIPVYREIFDEARGIRRDFLGNNHDIFSKKKELTAVKMKKCTYLATCNCMVRKNVAIEVGGFDPYYKFGGEDTDFGFNILKKGHMNMVSFEVGVHHHCSSSGRYGDETFRYHQTRVRFNLKHFSIKRNLLLFSIDLAHFLLFYFVLTPKIITQRIKKIQLTPENYLGGYYLLKAYLENMKKFSQLKQSKDHNFLLDEEFERFEAHSATCEK
jgi:GT2 family glycosyltransferase